MSKDISNQDDVIDSRDVIDRIEELETELMSVVDDNGNGHGLDNDSDAFDELEALRALAAEASDYAADWQYGETLIRDSYFEDYARELADDLGVMPSDAKWPMTCIDWEQAARELQTDYTSVEFDGVTYWIR